MVFLTSSCSFMPSARVVYLCANQSTLDALDLGAWPWMFPGQADLFHSSCQSGLLLCRQLHAEQASELLAVPLRFPPSNKKWDLLQQQPIHDCLNSFDVDPLLGLSRLGMNHTSVIPIKDYSCPN